MTQLAVIIVTYNNREIIGDCLRSCKRSLVGLNAKIVVVDNASHDGTADFIEVEHDDVKVIRSQYNRGFAGGNNLGVQSVQAEYYLLLNSDAFPDRDSIACGLQNMQDNPQVAIAGGLLISETGQVAPSARMFPSLINDFFALSGLSARFPKSRVFGRFDHTWADPSTPLFPDWVPGAFTIIRGEVFKRLGGFDLRFFLYYEEVDLCRRIREHGYLVAYWPEMKAVHIGGASSKKVKGGVVSRNGSQLTVWRMMAAMLYFRKHHGWFGAAASFALEYVWHGVRKLKNRADSAKGQESAWVMGALVSAWRDTAGGKVSPPTPW